MVRQFRLRRFALKHLTARPLVSAVWSDLLIASYAVPDHILRPFLPPGQQLDQWQGRAHLSVVAFRFQDARVLGAPSPPPFHNFPQWNLRFYVKPSDDVHAHSEVAEGQRGAQGERGVVFVKEFVPHPMVAATVRLLYQEPYQSAPLTCRTIQVGTLRRVRYDLTVCDRRHTLAVSARGGASVPAPGTAAAFFTGQGWGCGRDRAGRPIRFQVTHPPWRVYELEQCDLAVDFGLLYGPAWQFLQAQSPASVVLCEGSAVCVSRSQRA
jgi:uncharacterized protein YqjF (DUF2071 family)